MIKKILPIILSIIMLLMTIFISLETLNIKEYNLISYESESIVEKREININKQDLSLEEKIKFLSLYGSNDETSNLAIEDNENPFKEELTIEQIEKLYKEISKLQTLNGLPLFELKDLKSYYSCNIHTYSNDYTMISITETSFFIKDKTLMIKLYYDSESCEIYQYSMIDRRNNSTFKELEITKAFYDYIGLNNNDFNKYYQIFKDDNNVRVELLKTIQKWYNYITNIIQCFYKIYL